MEIIGYTGAILLAICAFPQFIMSIMQGNSNGLSYLFLLSWFFGDLLLLTYVYDTVGASGPLFYNYAANAIFLTVILYYRFCPRRS